MTELWINGYRVEPAQNISIKFISENIVFSKSSSYTLEVELPLSISANRNVFGWIDRMDVTKDLTQYPAKLIVDNMQILSGIATITTVTESSVKVQLLGEASAYSYRNKLDDIYIDALDLGDWYSYTWPDLSYYDYSGNRWTTLSSRPKTTAEAMYRTFNGSTVFDNGVQNDVMSRVLSGEYGWVAYPVCNRNTGTYFNNYKVGVSYDDQPHIRPIWLYKGKQDTILLSIQPLLWVMAKKIAQATGFTLSDDDNILKSDPLFSRLFIVTANNYNDCNRCLPHWSVNEWWSNIETTFGLIADINYDSKEMVLRRTKEHYTTTQTTYLDKVVDSYSSEVENEVADISTSSVGYSDCGLDQADDLSKDLIDAVTVSRRFNNLNDLLVYAQIMEQEWFDSNKHVLFYCQDGRQYIAMNDCSNGIPGFKEVNMLRSRCTNLTDDPTIQLKIVPAKYDHNYELHFLANNLVIVYDPVTHDSGHIINAGVLSVPDRDVYTVDNDKIDIEGVLNEEDEIPEKESQNDLLYLAIRPEPSAYDDYNVLFDVAGGDINLKYDTFKFPTATIREQGIARLNGTPEFRHAPYSLSLIPIDGQINMASQTLSSSAMRINTSVKHTIRFISDTMPDPSSLFVIRGKKYVCEKIEADITISGIKKLMTGYFFEVD